MGLRRTTEFKFMDARTALAAEIQSAAAPLAEKDVRHVASNQYAGAQRVLLAAKAIMDKPPDGWKPAFDEVQRGLSLVRRAVQIAQQDCRKAQEAREGIDRAAMAFTALESTFSVFANLQPLKETLESCHDLMERLRYEDVIQLAGRLWTEIDCEEQCARTRMVEFMICNLSPLLLKCRTEGQDAPASVVIQVGDCNLIVGAQIRTGQDVTV